MTEMTEEREVVEISREIDDAVVINTTKRSSRLVFGFLKRIFSEYLFFIFKSERLSFPSRRASQPSSLRRYSSRANANTHPSFFKSPKFKAIFKWLRRKLIKITRGSATFNLLFGKARTKPEINTHYSRSITRRATGRYVRLKSSQLTFDSFDELNDRYIVNNAEPSDITCIKIENLGVSNDKAENAGYVTSKGVRFSNRIIFYYVR